MRKHEEIQVMQQNITHAECDRCGRNLLSLDDPYENQEAHYFEFEGGYGSVFGDGVEVKLDLCQHCFKELLGDYVQVS